MTLRHLRIFVAVCHYGSITKAAQALHIAQPSVSLAIRELEAYYHLHLFDRISRRLYLTQEGERFLSYASHINELFTEMEQTIQQELTHKELRLGCSVTIANSLLCECLHAFQQQVPSCHPQVLIENSSILEEKILNGELDLALSEGLPSKAQIQKTTFFHDELAVICANEHAFAKQGSCQLEELLQQPLLLREKGSGTREIVDAILRTHNCIAHPLWESASTKALVRGVQHNFGLSILPYLMIKDSIHHHEVSRVMLQDISLQRDYYIIYHDHKYRSPLMQRFIDICCQLPKQLPALAKAKRT